MYKLMIMNKLKLLTTIMVIIFFGFKVTAQICPVTPGVEKIVNGDFELGNTGFTNSFAYCAGTCPSAMNPDQYFVTTNPNNQNNGYFKSMTDHTPGAGTNMLVFDFNNLSQNDPIYTTTVNVTAGKVYFFSAWFANIAINNTTACGSCPGGQYITNSPILKFKIAGVDQGIVHVDSITNNWNQYYTTWTAPSTTSITIDIVNLRGGTQSNDLALDDISFTDGCNKITNLNSLGQSSALIDTVKNCNISFPYVLDPALPGTYGYGWRNSAGTLLTAPATNTTYTVPAAPADGTKYYLCYEYIAGCPRMDSVIFKVTPLTVELGAPKIMCAPVNIVLNSGVTSPPVTVQWYKNGSPIATTANYTATDIGTYAVDISRAGCGSASDNVVISSPTSTLSGSGTYCTATNTASFTVSGSASVKWYIDNVSTSVLSTSLTYTPAQTATNTTTPGCTSGLYVEDASSFPGTLYPSAPCGSTSNTGGRAELMIEVNQTVVLNSFDFWHNAGWGATGTFTFGIYNNNPTGGPWCGGCTPNGTYDGVGSLIYTENTPSYTVGGSNTLRTLNLTTPQTLTPGKYWLTIVGNGTPIGIFNCTPAVGTTQQWSSPVADNTGNNVIYARKALEGGNFQNSGGMMNIKFQAGVSNSCQRLFICATSNCVAPVELISFDVKKYSNGNSLVWKTASEQNSAYYIIQRSTDGVNFENIGKVAAAGNSNAVLSYNYIDSKAGSSSVVYYRLEQVDLNGDKHYSEIRSIRNDEISQDINLYPTPVKRGQNVALDIIGQSDETITVEIFDNPGKVVSSGQFKITEGANTLELNTSSLASGLYHLRITGSSNRTTKFIVE
jgi:hypothetical protein